MKPGWMASIAMTTAAVAAATGPCKPTLLLTLENGQLAAALALGMAQGVTARIFAQVGVRVIWRTGADPAALLPCTEAVRIVLDEKAPAGFAADALAYATVGAAGTAIHVFYRRIQREHAAGLLPALLGHVFAHEVTHVLENVARHSEEGVLKAHWTQSDFDEMTFRPLRFASVDAELVRARFAL
jgi:hypothetical protein